MYIAPLFPFAMILADFLDRGAPSGGGGDSGGLVVVVWSGLDRFPRPNASSFLAFSSF